MPDRFFFVDERSRDGLVWSECRSHAARIGHERRSKRFKPLPVVLPWRLLSPNETDRASDQRTNSDERNRNKLQRNGMGSLIQQPILPLILGPCASPAAAFEGHRYIPFQLGNAANKTTLVYPAFDVSAAYTGEWVEILTDKVLFHATAAHLQAACESNNPPSKESLRQRGKALEALRTHLEDVICGRTSLSRYAVLASAHLAAVEEILQDNASHQMHRETIGRMLEVLGGLENLGFDPAVDVARQMEMEWALKSNYTVIPYRPAVQRGEERHRASNDITMSDVLLLPTGFRLLYTDSKISSQLVQVVQRIVTGLQVTKKTRRFGTEFRQFDSILDAIPCLQIGYLGCPTLEELIELAILEFCEHTLLPRNPGVKTHMVSRSRLVHFLPIYAALHNKPSCSEGHTFLWMWMLALYAWEAPIPDMDRKRYEVLNRFPLVEFSSMGEDEVEIVLRAFLWTEDFVVFGKKRWNRLTKDKTSTENFARTMTREH